MNVQSAQMLKFSVFMCLVTPTPLTGKRMFIDWEQLPVHSLTNIMLRNI